VLLAAFAHQYRSGLALRGWHPVDTKVYSDSALWLVFALCDYLKETGDFDLLTTRAPYYDGGDDTVAGHIEATLNWLEANKGAHDLCLIKFGDWNDSLTGIGKAGRGESVWLSMAYIHARQLMVDLCRHLGRVGDAEEHAARAAAMRAAVRQHAWDGEWFTRCFDDDGRPVGAAACEQGRIYVNAQSWALIADVADPAQIESLLRACDEQLLTSSGYRLVAPPYLKRDDHIGRISYLEPGICENGTIYSHGNAFMVYALLRHGLGDRAYDVFRRVAPGYTTSADDPKQNTPPYIFPNCYFGPEHRNRPMQAEFTWITGSVSWFYNAIIDYLVGVRRDYDSLVIDPVLPSEWPEVQVARSFRGRTFDIRIRRTGTRSLTLNGTSVPGCRLPLSQCRAANDVLATV
jgi:cellobiose phosphorylase